MIDQPVKPGKLLCDRWLPVAAAEQPPTAYRPTKVDSTRYRSSCLRVPKPAHPTIIPKRPSDRGTESTEHPPQSSSASIASAEVVDLASGGNAPFLCQGIVVIVSVARNVFVSIACEIPPVRSPKEKTACKWPGGGPRSPKSLATFLKAIFRFLTLQQDLHVQHIEIEWRRVSTARLDRWPITGPTCQITMCKPNPSAKTTSSALHKS